MDVLECREGSQMSCIIKKELEEQIGQLKEQNVELKRELATLKASAKRSEDEVARYRHRNEELSKELQACQKKNDDLLAQAYKIWQDFSDILKVEVVDAEQKQYEEDLRRRKLERINLEALELDQRSFKSLRCAEICNVAQLLDREISKILRIRHIGVHSAATIVAVVHAHGWYFANEENDSRRDSMVRRVLETAKTISVHLQTNQIASE